MSVAHEEVSVKYGEKWDRSVMKLNVSRDSIIENIRTNIKRPLPQLRPHQESPQHIAIVGGGWSLNDTYEELRELYFRGVKLIALNGSANWLVERNLLPSVHIVLDARPDNVIFVERPIPDFRGSPCKIFLASQCHSDLFEECDGRDVTIFHAMSDDSDIEKEMLDKHYNKRWIPVPSSATVGITAVGLCRSLGFRFQHLFGIDSCFSPEGEHHAYPQEMNDKEGSAWFTCADKKFRCSAVQASQAGNFIEMAKAYEDLVQLSVHGDGLIAHIVKTGAQLKEA